MASLKYTDKINSTDDDIKICTPENYEYICESLGCYEVTPDDRPIKLYFDIDIKGVIEEYYDHLTMFPNVLQYAKDIINRFIKEQMEINVTPEYCVCESNSLNFIDWVSKKNYWKLSIHLIVNNIIALKSTQLTIIKLLNEFAYDVHPDVNDYLETNNEGKLFDESVYSKNRKIRSLNCSKPGENRPLKLVEGTFQQSIISSSIPEDAVLFSLPEKKEESDVKNQATTTPKNSSLSFSEKDKKRSKMYFDLFMEKGVLYRYASEYASWRDIGFILRYEFGEDDGYGLFDDFSKLCRSKYDSVENRKWWNTIKEGHDKPITFASLIYMVKRDNPEIYEEIFSIVKQVMKKYQPNTDALNKYDIYFIDEKDLSDPFLTAKIISKTLKDTLVLSKEIWYMLTDNQLWKQQKEPSFYITNELRRYIDISNEKCVLQISKLEGAEKEVYIEKSKEYLKAYKSISSSGFLNVLTKYLRTLLTVNDFADKLDANTGKLAFKNGIMDLETLQFREGILSSDFITQTIPYDYTKADPSKIISLKSNLKKILNNNDEHLEYFLSIIGFCFIGIPHKEKSIYFCVDKTDNAHGDNGKTFYFDILTNLMPNYVYKSKGVFLEKGNTKVHKQLVNMKSKRLVWLDEYSTNKTNPELIKELADGLKIENEVMYGTTEPINILFKLFTLTNNLPNIDAKDSAVYNRYKQISYGSHFDRTGKRMNEEPEKLLFIADTSLGDTIKNEYYNEVFELVIEYANQYYKKGLPKIPEQFIKDTKETQKKNDGFNTWFDENMEIGEDYKIAEKVIINESGFKKDDVRKGMERLGYKYNWNLGGVGKNEKGVYYKGGYEGCRLVENMEE